MDYLLNESDHVWVLDYTKSTASSLTDPRVLSLLAKYLPVNFSLERTQFGRPFARSAHGPCVEFSIAHSHNLLIIAFSTRVMGADIEFMKSRAHMKKISQRYFGREHENLFDFYRSWTAREAYIKAQGQSIFTKLGNINLDSSDNILNFHIEFKLWDENYIIAICRPSDQQKALSYFSLRL